jgi:RHS repeat-associated protein
LEGFGEQDDEDVPKAFLNYIYINRDFDVESIRMGFEPITEAALEDGTGGAHEHLLLEYTVKEAGYVYVFLSNDGEEVREVYFDDFKIEHIKSPVIQSEDYYPFGAPFNSYSRENSVANKRLYQGKEYRDDLSLNIYDSDWRQYDPWGVRTTTMDPHAEKYFTQSPYSWSANNPIKFIDPDGRDWYLSLHNGQVQYIEGSGSQFDKAFVHLAADGASTGEIRDALNSRGYSYAVNGNIPGGYQVDTQSAYKGWITMQTFSPENVGGVLGLAGGAFGGGASSGASRTGSVWGFNPSQRGMMIERALGGNLPTNFPVVDKLANGVATSIKSIDVTAKSYQKSGALLGTLKGYVNSLKNFSGSTYGRTTIQEGVDFTSKSLEVAVQPGKASLNQWEQIGKAMQYAKDNGVDFTLKFVK